MIMKKILFTLALLWSVAYGQFCADEDTVRSNSATQITATTARINGTTSHFTGAVVSLQLKYVRVGQTDTVTSSGTGALRNLTGLQPATQYVYYYKSICGSGSQSQTIGPYRFTTLANTILYVDERPTRFYHWKADSSMIVPQGDTVVGREPSTLPQIRYKTSDNTFYGYYPNCACWRALAIDSSGIIGLLDGKVDSVTVNGDSLFYWKVGVSYGYILPALANTWRIIGNSGTDTSINFLGTSDNVPLKIRTNNTDRVIIGVDGSFTVDNSTGNNLTATSDSKMQVSTGTYDNAINIGESAVSISSSQTGFLNSASGITIYPDSIMLQPLQGALSIDTLTNLSSQNALIGWIQGSGQGRIGYVTIGAGLSLSSGALSLSGGSSQWTTSGSDIYYNTGNVGIGTSSPATKIHATASGAVAKFVSSGYVQNTVEISDPDGYTYITNGQFKVGSVPFVMNANGSYITYQTGGVDRMRVTYAGDVGIGNTSPGEKLEVTGNIKASGKVISRNVIYQTSNKSDADFTAAAGTAYVLPDPSAARTITLPTGQDADKILFYLPVSPSNSWNLSTNVTILDGSTVNKLDAYGPGAIYLIYDGANSVWRLIPNM